MMSGRFPDELLEPLRRVVLGIDRDEQWGRFRPRSQDRLRPAPPTLSAGRAGRHPGSRIAEGHQQQLAAKFLVGARLAILVGQREPAADARQAGDGRTRRGRPLTGRLLMRRTEVGGNGDPDQERPRRRR